MEDYLWSLEAHSLGGAYVADVITRLSMGSLFDRVAVILGMQFHDISKIVLPACRKKVCFNQSERYNYTKQHSEMSWELFHKTHEATLTFEIHDQNAYRRMVEQVESIVRYLHFPEQITDTNRSLSVGQLSTAELVSICHIADVYRSLRENRFRVEAEAGTPNIFNYSHAETMEILTSSAIAHRISSCVSKQFFAHIIEILSTQFGTSDNFDFEQSLVQPLDDTA